jgi:putative flippase GtrA
MSEDIYLKLKFLINGVGATVIHFSVLSINLYVLNMPSAGLANMIAAIFGISASFLGSRYFVFKQYETPLIKQAMSFGILYGVTTILHGLVMLVWTDWLGNAYQVSFLLATFLQMLFSYFGNKNFVFAK